MKIRPLHQLTTPPRKPRNSKGDKARRRRWRRARGELQIQADPTPRPDEACPEWQALKMRVLSEEKRCRRCGTIYRLTVDHIVPLVLGGGNHRANLQCLCRGCNRRKGAQMPLDQAA